MCITWTGASAIPSVSLCAREVAIYASCGTSLVDTRGRLQPDFMLGDVFGVSLDKADWQDRDHYIAPTAAGRTFFGEWNPKYPAFDRGGTFRREGATRRRGTCHENSALARARPDEILFHPQ